MTRGTWVDPGMQLAHRDPRHVGHAARDPPHPGHRRQLHRPPARGAPRVPRRAVPGHVAGHQRRVPRRAPRRGRGELDVEALGGAVAAGEGGGGAGRGAHLLGPQPHDQPAWGDTLNTAQPGVIRRREGSQYKAKERAHDTQHRNKACISPLTPRVAVGAAPPVSTRALHAP